MFIHKKGIEYTQMRIQYLKRQLILCKEDILENRFLKSHDHESLFSVLEQFLILNKTFRKYCQDSLDYLDNFENKLTQIIILGSKHNVKRRVLDHLHKLQHKLLGQLYQSTVQLDIIQKQITDIAEIEEFQDFDDFSEIDHLVEANTVQEQILHLIKHTSIEMATYVELILTNIHEAENISKTKHNEDKYVFLKHEDTELSHFDTNIRSWLTS